MNKKIGIILVIVVTLLIGGGIFLYFNNTSSSNKSNYEANRTSSENTSNQTNETKENNTVAENQSAPSTINETTKSITEAEQTPPVTEEQIATFTTKIYSKDSARQNNISITCKSLNGTIVKNGNTFSFCNTVGAASTSKGYQKADIFDKNGNKKKGLGGRKLSNKFYLV